MLAAKLIITALCALGLYASVFMYRKALLAQSGGLAEPSVVQRPAARLFLGVPNALFGIFYYLALGMAVWVAAGRMWVPLGVAVCAAALVSLYLAYSLLFVTRMECRFCWTSHVINWLLVFLVWYLFRFA